MRWSILVLAPKYKVRICRGPSCGDKRNSRELADEFRRHIAERALQGIELGWQSCYGRCRRGPNVLVREVGKMPKATKFVFATPPLSRGGKATMYNHITKADVADIVAEHLEAGRPVQRLIEKVPDYSDIGDSNDDGDV